MHIYLYAQIHAYTIHVPISQWCQEKHHFFFHFCWNQSRTMRDLVNRILLVSSVCVCMRVCGGGVHERVGMSMSVSVSISVSVSASASKSACECKDEYMRENECECERAYACVGEWRV